MAVLLSLEFRLYTSSNSACTQAVTPPWRCVPPVLVKTKIRRARKTKLTCKKAKVLKGGGQWNRQLRRPVLLLEPSDMCCEEKTRNSQDVYLIMGNIKDSKLRASFIMPWAKRSQPFKKAVRMFKQLNCTDPKLVSHSVIGDAFGSSVSNGAEEGKVSGLAMAGRRKRGRAKKHPTNSS
uniref:NTR domain-containing protein n=1 Tax=Timema shepardi TaxID=629360 RepID=A0A7R9G262_TIMSH|nr:unnamed protein product [Timema shepardi]